MLDGSNEAGQWETVITPLEGDLDLLIGNLRSVVSETKVGGLTLRSFQFV